jgi:hypothetical protein
MCGLVDFDALNTSITRLAGLSFAGMVTFAVSKAVSACRKQKTKADPRERKAPAGARRRVALADSR